MILVFTLALLAAIPALQEPSAEAPGGLTVRIVHGITGAPMAGAELFYSTDEDWFDWSYTDEVVGRSAFFRDTGTSLVADANGEVHIGGLHVTVQLMAEVTIPGRELPLRGVASWDCGEDPFIELVVAPTPRLAFDVRNSHGGPADEVGVSLWGEGKYGKTLIARTQASARVLPLLPSVFSDWTDPVRADTSLLRVEVDSLPHAPPVRLLPEALSYTLDEPLELIAPKHGEVVVRAKTRVGAPAPSHCFILLRETRLGESPEPDEQRDWEGYEEIDELDQGLVLPFGRDRAETAHFACIGLGLKLRAALYTNDVELLAVAEFDGPSVEGQRIDIELELEAALFEFDTTLRLPGGAPLAGAPVRCDVRIMHKTESPEDMQPIWGRTDEAGHLTGATFATTSGYCDLAPGDQLAVRLVPTLPDEQVYAETTVSFSLDRLAIDLGELTLSHAPLLVSGTLVPPPTSAEVAGAPRLLILDSTPNDRETGAFWEYDLGSVAIQADGTFEAFGLTRRDTTAVRLELISDTRCIARPLRVPLGSTGVEVTSVPGRTLDVVLSTFGVTWPEALFIDVTDAAGNTSLAELEPTSEGRAHAHFSNLPPGLASVTWSLRESFDYDNGQLGSVELTTPTTTAHFPLHLETFDLVIEGYDFLHSGHLFVKAISDPESIGRSWSDVNHITTLARTRSEWRCIADGTPTHFLVRTKAGEVRVPIEGPRTVYRWQ